MKTTKHVNYYTRKRERYEAKQAEQAKQEQPEQVSVNLQPVE